MIIVQVLGTNGSGKSRLLQEMARQDSTAALGSIPVPATPKGVVPVTWLPKWGAVLVGDYLGTHKTPGADKLRGTEVLLGTLDSVLLTGRQGYRYVVWEGIMLLTRAFPKAYEARGVRAIYPVLRLPPEAAYARVVQRSGPTKRGVDKVAKRNREVESLARWVEVNGSTVWSLHAGGDPGALARTILRRLWNLDASPFT